MVRVQKRFGALRACLALLALSHIVAGAARAQVDLPAHRGAGGTSSSTGSKPASDAKDGKQGDKSGEEKKPEKKPVGHGVVPHLVCAVCGEHNYTSARNRPTEGGFFTAWCANCQCDRIHRPSESAKDAGDLDLPRGGGTAARAHPAVVEKSAPAPVEQTEPAPDPLLPVPRGGDQREAAASIYHQVEALEDFGAPFVAQAVENLVAMGEDGLMASRIALHDESPVGILTAARVLLLGGNTDDALRVVERMRESLPLSVGPKLLEEIIERDPVHGSPELLVSLLDHPQQRVRDVARHHLQKQLAPELVPQLARALESKRAETRLDAVQLLAGIDDPRVFDLLIEDLDDPAARVASEAVAAVAGIDDPRVSTELEARAFNGRWTLRENAYALLAIIEREDLRLEPILDERHAESLLRALEMTDPFIFGTCAAALAGIGFRSDRPEESGWLDREVTGRLVAVVSGREFHPDYSALQPRALRRLKLISGQDFGTDGPAWARWWIENRNTFYARRVRIPIAGDRVRLLELHYTSTAESPDLFSLFGPGADEDAVRARAGAAEVFRLTESECRDLSQVLEREGVLGAERLPGQRGEPSPRSRKIEVLVDGRGKSFTFAEGGSEPWFERVAAALCDIRDRNRWQRYPDLTAHASERGFWEGESPWWEGEHGELERALRLKELVLAAARTYAPSRRNVVVDELERLYGIPGVASVDDFRALVDLLRDEGFFIDRTRRLLALAVRSASQGAAEGSANLPEELAASLLDLLGARFGLEVAQEMASIAEACGKPYVRQLAKDARPLFRAVAAAGLGRALESANHAGGEGDSEEAQADRTLLLGMLEDSEPTVEAACCLALGGARVEEARPDLLVRARGDQPAVRAAALRALADLGGDHVLEALVLGASAPDAGVRRAAAEGLARMRDPRTAPVLVSLLGQGRESEVFEPAREGLLKLGEGAWPELARVANSTESTGRREATLLLAYQGVPRAAGGLIGMLAEDPKDELVAEELAVLSCVDFRDAPDPADQWDRWWSGVVHDDSRAWLRAAMERRGVGAPGPSSLQGRGTLDGALFLLDVMARPEPYLAERGRRELARMLERDIGELPHGAAERAAWLGGLRAAVSEHW